MTTSDRVRAWNEKVKAWIEENFELEAIKLEPFPALPGGHIITDKNGETMLVYYDWLTDRIKYKLEGSGN